MTNLSASTTRDWGSNAWRNAFSDVSYKTVNVGADVTFSGWVLHSLEGSDDRKISIADGWIASIYIVAPKK